MRSGLGGVVLVVALVGAAAAVLVLVQSVGMRDELAATRAAVTELRSEVEALERGVPMSELSLRMGELENEVQRWVIALSGDAPEGGLSGPLPDQEEVLERLEELLDEVRALGRRVDEICEGVPVC